MGCLNTRVAPVSPVQNYSEPTAEELNNLQEQLSRSLAHRGGSTSSNRGRLSLLGSSPRRPSHPLPPPPADGEVDHRLLSEELPGTPMHHQGPQPVFPFHANKQLPVKTSLRGLASESQVIFFQKLDEKINAGPELRKVSPSERPNS